MPRFSPRPLSRYLDTAITLEVALPITTAVAAPPRPHRPTPPFSHVTPPPPPLSRRCWNAVNNPVFGWLSDHCCVRRNRRATAVRFGGLIWALSFIALWLPLTPQPSAPSDASHSLQDGTAIAAAAAAPSAAASWLATLHFVLTLCVYDGGLTYVEVNHSALLAEVSTSPVERARCNMWAGIGAGVGSLSSWVGYVYWDAGSVAGFRWMALCLGGVCAVVFEVSGRAMLVLNRDGGAAAEALGHDALHGANGASVVSPKGLHGDVDCEDGPSGGGAVSRAGRSQDSGAGGSGFSSSANSSGGGSSSPGGGSGGNGEVLPGAVKATSSAAGFIVFLKQVSVE